MPYITHKSALAYEVVRIHATKDSVPVIAGMNGTSPVIITRKRYKADDGRLFVAYANGFRPVIAPDASDTAYRFGFGNFTRGAWHWVDGIGWEEGIAPEANGDAEAETAEANATDAAEHADDSGEFNLLDFFS